MSEYWIVESTGYSNGMSWFGRGLGDQYQTKEVAIEHANRDKNILMTRILNGA